MSEELRLEKWVFVLHLTGIEVLSDDDIFGHQIGAIYEYRPAGKTQKVSFTSGEREVPVEELLPLVKIPFGWISGNVFHDLRRHQELIFAATPRALAERAIALNELCKIESLTHKRLCVPRDFTRKRKRVWGK